MQPDFHSLVICIIHLPLVGVLVYPEKMIRLWLFSAFPSPQSVSVRFVWKSLRNFETRVTLRSYNCFYILTVYDSWFTHDPAWLNKFTWSLLTFCLYIVANSPPIYQTSRLLTTLNLCVIKHWEQNLQVSCTYQFCIALGTTYITSQDERKLGFFCYFFSNTYICSVRSIEKQANKKLWKTNKLFTLTPFICRPTLVSNKVWMNIV